VVRFRLWLATAVVLGAIAGTLLRAQVRSEEEKSGDEFGKSQHETHASSSPTPKKSPKPVAKTKAGESKSKKKRSASPTSGKSPSPIAKATLATKESNDKTDTSATRKESSDSTKAKESGEEDEGTPRPKPTETPESTVASKKSKKSPSPTPKPKGAKKTSQKKNASGGKKAAKGKSTGKKAKPKPEKTPTPPPEKPAEQPEDSTPPPPRAFAAPTPARSPQVKVPGAVPAEERAQVVIEKSGIEEDQGLEPPPLPPARKGFWPWSLGRPREYRYLTRSVIEEIRRAPVKRRRWQFIVVHNSGTRQGNARAFDYYHRHVRRMPNGLAYHFVIGNGTSTGNGQIEVGDRWRRQINGGHVHSDYLNNISLGICLVGDFNRDQPTHAQLDACEELIRYLRQRCGKIGMHNIVVRPHREMNPPRWPTDCPGDVFPYSWFRRF
jgi:hypothetical protein